MKLYRILLAFFIILVLTEFVVSMEKKRRHKHKHHHKSHKEEEGEAEESPEEKLAQYGAQMANKMVNRIRSKGTFIMNLVEYEPSEQYHTPKEGEVTKNTQEATEEVSGEAQTEEGDKKEGEGEKTDEPLPPPRDNSDMFNGDKVELPMICDKLRPEETAGLLSHAASYLNAWGTAGEAKAPFIFNDLPVLKPDQFVKFYQSITEGVVAQEGEIDPKKAEEDPAALMQTALLGDKNRVDIAWLEFWVYMCGGTKENKDQWMGPDQSPKKLEEKEVHRQAVIQSEKDFNKKRADEHQAKLAEEAAAKAKEGEAEQTEEEGAQRKRKYKKHHKKHNRRH